MELRQFTGLVVATVNTDGTGSFRFENLKPGDYILVAQQAGFEPAHESLILTDFSLRGIQLYLKKPASDVSVSYEPGSVLTSWQKIIPRNTAIVASPVKSQSTPPVSPGQLPQSATLASPAPTTRVAALDSRPWPPPELMEAKLLAGTQPPCSLTQVLQSASQRVKELAGDLQSITATETIEHRQVDKAGTAGPPKATTFNYLFSITEVRPGILSVEEMRNGNLLAGDFPTSTATTGLPAIAMIFHPFYISDFDMTCEGMTQWRGQPAWLVRFEQRKGVPGRIYSFRADGLSFAVSLRGRAWIAASNYQLLRLVTELAEPIAKISLHTVSLAIEYRPVQFHVKGKQLWLPAVAEAYLDFLGHRYYQRHTFRGYELFAVDTFQKIENPRQQP